MNSETFEVLLPQEYNETLLNKHETRADTRSFNQLRDISIARRVLSNGSDLNNCVKLGNGTSVFGSGSIAKVKSNTPIKIEVLFEQSYNSRRDIMRQKE